MAKTDKKRGLGRGLSALMADVNEAATAPAEQNAPSSDLVPIEKVFPNPDQPRKRFTESPQALSIRMPSNDSPRSRGETLINRLRSPLKVTKMHWTMFRIFHA